MRRCRSVPFHQQADHQFDEELVPVVVADDAGIEPLLEGILTGGGEGVDALFRPALFLHTDLGHQPGLGEPLQRGVDLARLDLPRVPAADQCLKGGAQFVAVARLLGQQSQKSVADGHREK
jgi:hypothetical protein